MEVKPNLILDFLYISDSGPWGETSIENPTGSVYVIEVESNHIRRLAYSCLAFPSGIDLSPNNKILYVCETGKNRILRFIVYGNQLSNFR